jgi:hypothetical protein
MNAAQTPHDDRISGGFPVYVNDPNSGEETLFWLGRDDAEPVSGEYEIDVDFSDDDGTSMVNLEAPTGDRLSEIGEESISLDLVVTTDSPWMKEMLETEVIVPMASKLLAAGYEASLEDLLAIEQFPETMRLADIYATCRDSLNKPCEEAAALACLAFYGPGALSALMQ